MNWGRIIPHLSGRAHVLISLALFALGILYITPKIFEPSIGAVDFKYFWLAGSLSVFGFVS